ncbi:sugar ABC transporter permease [uncultured Sphaerochaeta sp.]|uniref:carbohydrate ABC transporter permease n=1 Tax=uncultured Sphaerochaeta sp. TaxID=886478 RepID=UPI002A0A6DA6|nr:sugar ABC transporter permease [uncultured Sphaerochaeta sp.]
MPRNQVLRQGATVVTRRVSLEARDNRVGKLFLVPAISVLVIIVAYPVIYSFIMSFFRWRPIDPNRPFVGLKNYIRVMSDERFFLSIRNTFIYALVGAFFKVMIGLGLALMMNRNFKGRGIARTLLMLPWVLPVTASVTIWNWMFDGMYGIINVMLMRMGLIDTYINFLGQKGVALACVLIVGIWMGYPQMMMMQLAGLQSIPLEMYEAAKVEGANSFQVFFRITLPSLAGILQMAIILSIIWTFNSFNVIWLMTRGGSSTHTMNTLAYEFSFVNMRYDLGAALSVTILIFLAVFLFIHSKMTKKMGA